MPNVALHDLEISFEHLRTLQRPNELNAKNPNDQSTEQSTPVGGLGGSNSDFMGLSCAILAPGFL